MKHATPTALLTGFEPFGDDPENPSWDAVRPLNGRRIAGHRIVALQLPVEFGNSLRILRGAIRETRPALVLCTGLAGGRAQLSLERVAINIDDARIPDNAGRQPVDSPVVEGGPAAYFSTLPLKAMMLALRESGIPAEVSQSAGTYVCNHVFYGLMHALRARRGVRAGFVHVPYSTAQATHHPGAPSMPVEMMTEALRVALHCAMTTGGDVRIAAGREH